MLNINPGMIGSDLNALQAHVQYDGFAAGDLNRLSGPVGQNGSGERRHMETVPREGSASSSPTILKLC